MAKCLDCSIDVPRRGHGPCAKRCEVHTRAARIARMNKYAKTRLQTRMPWKLAYNREYAALHPEKMLWRKAKRRAEEKSLPFTISPSDVVIPAICPVLGLILNREPLGFLNDHLATIDRVIPELGYTPSNIVVISWRANRLKGNGTLPELEAICQYLRGHLGVT